VVRTVVDGSDRERAAGCRSSFEAALNFQAVDGCQR
jgi:hypothetical protein